jgi:hypothetical protein
MNNLENMSMAELAAAWRRLGDMVADYDSKIERLRDCRNSVAARRDELARAASELSMNSGAE